ncbi:hypothetical protein [Kitasatospora sp. NPDC058478]|uniref:hypothetical protein n=1 Tax=unclassified Kitasatospora TaxID=2633591 RepID=UPI003659CD44
MFHVAYRGGGRMGPAQTPRLVVAAAGSATDEAAVPLRHHKASKTVHFGCLIGAGWRHLVALVFMRMQVIPDGGSAHDAVLRTLGSRDALRNLLLNIIARQWIWVLGLHAAVSD